MTFQFSKTFSAEKELDFFAYLFCLRIRPIYSWCEVMLQLCWINVEVELGFKQLVCLCYACCWTYGPLFNYSLIKILLVLARAVGIPVGRRLGGWLATMLVATKYVFNFFSPVFSPPSQPFLKKRVLGSKVDGSAQKPFQTLSAILGAPIGQFGFCRWCDIANNMHDTVE